jgi:hypothetical protein
MTKRNIVGVIAIALIMPVLTILAFKALTQNTPKEQKIKLNYAKTITDANAIKLVFVDSVDGRPVYDVIFPDGKVMDYMYPEEIAHSLIVGKWEYDEDLKIK